MAGKWLNKLPTWMTTRSKVCLAGTASALSCSCAKSRNSVEKTRFGKACKKSQISLELKCCLLQTTLLPVALMACQLARLESLKICWQQMKLLLQCCSTSTWSLGPTTRTQSMTKPSTSCWKWPKKVLSSLTQDIDCDYVYLLKLLNLCGSSVCLKV